VKATRLLLTILFTTGISLHSGSLQAQQSVSLWPEDELPNSKGLSIQDSVKNDRIYLNKYPEMYSFHPAKEENSGAAVLIFPSGGYHHLTYDLGGFQLAKWFNTLGVHSFVVNYRLPLSPDLVKREIAPLQDAQRAMRLVRSMAEELGIDPDKIGVMGTSAGGHLASTIGTFHEDVSAFGDSLDQYSYRPDFMVMISPVITFGEYAHEGSRMNLLGENPSPQLINKYSTELQVDKDTPPAFLGHAANDESVHPMNSIIFYEALLQHGNTASSLHIFPQGGHSIGLVGNPGSTQMWSDLCEAWLKESGFIE